jgi:hypothetical protein
MRGGWARVGWALSAAVLVTSACGEPPEVPALGLTGGWETAGCEFSPSEPTTPAPAAPPSLSSAMSRIEHGGRTDYPASYAGLEVDEARVRAVVYRVPSAEFDDFIRINAQDACVVVRDSLHALRELTEWHDRIVADLGIWSAKGIRIVTVGARNDGFGVEIGSRDVDRARTELQTHYGEEAPLIFVQRGPVIPMAQPGPVQAPRAGG